MINQISERMKFLNFNISDIQNIHSIYYNNLEDKPKSITLNLDEDKIFFKLPINKSCDFYDKTQLEISKMLKNFLFQYDSSTKLFISYLLAHLSANPEHFNQNGNTEIFIEEIYSFISQDFSTLTYGTERNTLDVYKGYSMPNFELFSLVIEEYISTNKDLYIEAIKSHPMPSNKNYLILFILENYFISQLN